MTIFMDTNVVLADQSRLPVITPAQMVKLLV